MKFQVEQFSGVYLEIEPYFQAHYDELATFKDKIPKVECDYKVYAELEEKGALLVCTARESGALVGYFWGFLAHHPHYKNILMCSADAYYLAPEYRKAQNGVLFIRFIEKSAKERGAHMLVMGTKMQKDLGVFYQALGYTETDRVFRRWLRD